MEPVVVTKPAELADVTARARVAQSRWGALPVRERAAALLRFRGAILDAADRVAETVSAETRKPRAESHAVELFYVLEGITCFARNAERWLAEERIRPRLLKHKRVVSRWRPRGVAGIISPWNFPFAIPIGDAVPALAAGNAVIVKPSELTPRSALLGSALWREAGLPADLLQVVVGEGELGATLIEYTDSITFTGSVVTGRRVAARCGELLKPCTLELGGKDPMIVCTDANLERAASACAWGALLNAGQACLSIERVYVEEAVYEEFLRLLVPKVQAIRLGDPDEAPDVGPLASAAQLETVERHVQDAQSRGARALVGGGPARPEDGFFFEPTVLVDVDHTMACMRDETFGPTIPIMKVRDVEQAIELANDSPYGLGASVFTRDRARGLAIARRLHVGGVCVNDCLVQAFLPNAPMGGVKSSGLGRRHGREGLRKFCDQQTLVVDRLGLRSEPFWYPLGEAKLAWLKRAQRWLYRGTSRARDAAEPKRRVS